MVFNNTIPSIGQANAQKRLPVLKLLFGKQQPYARKVEVKLNDDTFKTNEQETANSTNAHSIDLTPSADFLMQLHKQLMQHVMDAFKKGIGKVPNGARKVTTSLPETGLPGIELPVARIAKELSEHAVLQGYNPRLYRKNPTPPKKMSTVVLNNLPSTPDVKAALREGTAVGNGMNLTRHLVDAPPNIKNPLWVSQQAKALESPTMRVEAHDYDWIKNQKMGMFLSVAAGNQRTTKDAPRLVEMVYTPADGKYSKTVLLVGKGIMFDTGGTNLKNAADQRTGKLYIHGMHGDMAGAAAVIGAMKTIDDLQLSDVRVVGLTPLTPNRIGENATLPHSIVTARNGKTVEIGNTDAEGRLVLGDALHYGGEKYSPDLIVDIATLTGGKVAAVGGANAVGVMSNDFKMAKQVAELEDDMGRKTGAYEITKAHTQWVTKGGNGKADVCNSVGYKSGERYNLYGPGVPFDRDKHVAHHMIQGGAFLKEFLPDVKTPWVHLDMAGAEFEPDESLDGEEYATGFGVKDLFNITKSFVEGSLTAKTEK